MRKITKEQADAWSNLAAAITGFVVMGLMLDFISFKVGAIVAFIAQSVIGLLTGRGIPTVQTIVQELNINHAPPSPPPTSTAMGNYAPYPGVYPEAVIDRPRRPPVEVGRWMQQNQEAFDQAEDDDPITQSLPTNARY